MLWHSGEQTATCRETRSSVTTATYPSAQSGQAESLKNAMGKTQTLKVFVRNNASPRAIRLGVLPLNLPLHYEAQQYQRGIEREVGRARKLQGQPRKGGQWGDGGRDGDASSAHTPRAGTGDAAPPVPRSCSGLAWHSPYSQEFSTRK